MADNPPNFQGSREDLQDFSDSISTSLSHLILYSNRIVDEWKYTDDAYRTVIVAQSKAEHRIKALEAVNKNAHRDLKTLKLG